MAIPSLFNTYIDETYQRLVQVTGSGTEFADGLGNPITFGTTPTSSLLTTASAAGNTITFTKGDGSTFPVTVTGGGTPGDGNQSIQFNSASVFSGSSNLKYDYVNSNIILTGSLLVTQSHISSLDYVDFALWPTTTNQPAQNEGRLFWNSDQKTLQLDLEQNFHTDLNQQMLVRVVNKTGADIPIGRVVFISGSQGNRPGIKLSSYETDSTSAATVGFTAKTINNNNNGYVLTRGILDGLDTSAFAVGDRLFLSSSGTFNNIPPDAPLHEVRLGKVIVSDATNGSIYVDVMNGYELDELHDVKATNPNYGDLFMYSASLWTATKTLSGSYTLSGSLTTNGGVNAQALTASIVSASQFTGSLFGTASWATNAITSSYPIAITGSTIYTPILGQGIGVTTNVQTLNNIFLGAGAGSGSMTSSAGTNTRYSTFIGHEAGWRVTSAREAIMIGYQAGYNATSSRNAVFLGTNAGGSATNAQYSNFIGQNAGSSATSANNSNFIGISAGQNATNAQYSNFIGNGAGNGATSAINTVCIGTDTGTNAANASYSTLIGYQAGFSPGSSVNSIGTNNIIIGNSISLPIGTQNSFNIGGVLFGKNIQSVQSYGVINTGSINGYIGVNVVSPSYNLEVSGSVAFTNLTNSTQTNVIGIDSNGQLFKQPAGGGTAASSDEITLGTGSNVVQPDNLEQSKYTTVNIFNFLNFS